MTGHAFYNYSAGMDADLKALEEKLSQLVAVCHSLRAENLNLKKDLVQAQGDVQQLKTQMTQASSRLALLIDQLPQHTEN